MSRRAITTIFGLGAAGAGYYLYTAGGDPKVAEKQFQKDVAKITDNRSGEAQKGGEELANQAKAKFDSAYSDAKDAADRYGKDAQKKFDQGKADAEKYYAQGKADATSKFNELRSETGKAIDKFDSAVEKKATEAKSGISSWFGGK